MQELPLQALALLAYALALCCKGSLGFGCRLRCGLVVLQCLHVVKQRAVGLVKRCAVQGAQGGGVTLQLQELPLQALALAQDVGGAAQSFGGLITGGGQVFHYRGDPGEGAAELHQHREVLAPGFGVQVLRFDQLAVSVARGGQGHAQAAQGFGELCGGLGGALGLAVELRVVAGRGLGEVLQAAEGIG